MSVIVNFFNNSREMRNSLFSMTREYQSAPDVFEFEVIAIDHGSTKPLSESEVKAFGNEFKYRYVKTTAVSPAQAINDACRAAAGDLIVVVIDGAHILSPGIFRRFYEAFRMFRSPFIAVPAMHLGPKAQYVSVLEGYNQTAEDRLLESVKWRENGYALYSIARQFSDSSGGWFGNMFESNCFALKKSDYLSLGGYDVRFKLPGGGLVNLDFYNRAIATPTLDYVIILGECTFHQFHGGVATNAPRDQQPWDKFAADYVSIRGEAYQQVLRKPYFLGTMPQEALDAMAASMNHGATFWSQLKN
jgi:Glycosyl transferase family 2